MSNRSSWPSGVEVHQRHLEYDTAQRTASDKQTLADITTRGVISGLGVTVGGTNTRVSIASGSAYAPNGEFMTLAVGQSNVALADSTLGVVNYVLLVYDETSISPESHETDGTTRNTKVTVTPRLTILTQSVYNALPQSNSVLTSNDKDRAVILAKVTANGPAIALTSGSIEKPSPFPSALSVTQPTLINGVTVISVDATTPTGTGSLTFAIAPTRLSWAAPSDTAGTPVTLTGTGSYVLSSSNGKTCLVLVTFSNLPSIALGPDNITVTAIYTQSVARQSAEDFQHRSMIGSGAPTVANPHGMTIDDLSAGVQGTLAEHQDVQHSNGIARFSNTNTLKTTVDLNGGSPDTIRVGSFHAGDYCYVNGNKINTLDIANDLSLSGNDGKLAFTNAGDTAVSTWLIYLNQDAILVKSKRAEIVPVLGDLTDKLQIVNVSNGITTGTCTVTWNNPGGGSTINAGGHSKPAPTASSIIRLYLANDVNYIDVFVRGAATPVATQTATVTFTAALDAEENIQLGSVLYTGFGSGHLGYGYGLDNAPNTVYDKRPYGNLGKAEISDNAGYTEPASIVSGMFEDGVVLSASDYGDDAPNVLDIPTDRRTRQNAFDEDLAWPVGTIAGASLNMGGGVAYVGGRKFDVPATVAKTLSAGTINRIYIDFAGVAQSSAASWDIILGGTDGHPILPLWDVTLDGGGNETLRHDLRNILSFRHNVELGTVGLNKYRQVSIGTTSNATSSSAISVLHNGASGSAVSAVANGSSAVITALSLGTGNGVLGSGGISGGHGIVGQGTAAGTRGGSFTGGPTSGPGVVTLGTGSGSGISSTGGNTAGSTAGSFFGGSTDGNALLGQATGSGTGVQGSGGATNGSAGGIFSSQATNGKGSRSLGAGTGAGAEAVGGATDGSFAAILTSAATNGHALSATATGTGNAGQFTSATGTGVTIASTSGVGASIATTGVGLSINSTAGANAITSVAGDVGVPPANNFKYTSIRTGHYNIPAQECRFPLGNVGAGWYGQTPGQIGYGPADGTILAAPFTGASVERRDLCSVIIQGPAGHAKTKVRAVARLPEGAIITEIAYKAANWHATLPVTGNLFCSVVNSGYPSAAYATPSAIRSGGTSTIPAVSGGLNGAGVWNTYVVTPFAAPSDGWIQLDMLFDLDLGGTYNSYFEFFQFRITYTYTIFSPAV